VTVETTSRQGRAEISITAKLLDQKQRDSVEATAVETTCGKGSLPDSLVDDAFFFQVIFALVQRNTAYLRSATLRPAA
jgi:hypothetical protein